MKGRTLNLIFLILSAMLLLPAQVAIAEPPVLRVGYEPDLAPLNFDEEGRAVGFTVELLQKILGEQKLQIEFVPLVKSEAIKRMSAGEIDVIASIPYSSLLSEQLEFSEPFFTSSIGILVPKEADSEIENLANLSGALVALQSHTLEYDFLKNVRNIRYQVSNSQHTALKFFLAGRADVFVGSVDTASYYLHQYQLENRFQFSQTYFMPAEYAFGVPKGNYKLLSKLNSGIRQAKSSGAYSELYRRWFDHEAEAVSSLVRFIWKVGAGVVSVFLVVLVLNLRWNRQLKRQVEHKTLDLQRLNQTLVEQIEIAQNNNEFLKQILESSIRAIIILDRNGFITESNKIVSGFLESRESPQGKHYRDIPLLSQLLEGKIEFVLSGRKTHYLGEHHQMLIVGGRPRDIRYHVYPLYQHDQTIIGIILTIEDVTAELEVRKKLFEQEKHRALSRMVAGIAHEVRNPLSSIKTFVELIPQKINNEKFQKEISTTVPREIVRISKLIDGLISYARPRNVKNETVSTRKLIDESVLLFLHIIKSKGFQLLRTEVEDLQVITDHDQMKQVLINLLINAIDALSDADEANGQLRIEFKSFKVDGRVCIQVADNGIGMSSEEKANALEPFFTTKPKGTGLGLPLAQQLVSESNGEMLIESEKGAGTTVSIFLEQAGV